MNPQCASIPDILSEALRLPAAERPAFLAAACGDDNALRQRVEQLLTAYPKAGQFLESAAGGPAPTIESAPSEVIGTLIGPYKLLEQIGEGGMGLVYMAEQQQPVRRLVALKLVKPGMDSKQVIARFEAERQALAMMDHPNIAKILDAGTVGQASSLPVTGPAGSPPHEGRPYFIMELVRGIPINEFCDQKRLSVRERLELVIQVCQAVQHAHQKGIIHRDLKPTNVLVTMHDAVAVPKVIDFGIAKALGPSLTDHTLHTGFAQLVGTPLYMSPEQAEMNQFGVDTRSDVYSLGVMLYELLTGTTPFDKDRLKSASFDEMRRIIREEEPETISTRLARTRRGAGVSPALSSRQPPSAVATDGTRSVPTTYAELDWIVARSLEKDRTRRYESPSALAADLQRYLSDEPVLACPPTTMYRFQKFARKHKPALATAAAIAACLILGTTVSAWQAVRATTAETQANANADQAQEKTKEATQERDEAQRQRDEVRAVKDQLQRTLYAAHMNLAKNVWDAGGIDRARELLDRHRPKLGQSDPRGFEWHYLNRLCQSELLNLQHGAKIYTMAYSPDGKHLASAGGSAVRIWDAESGREVRTFECQEAWGVAFSPDGKRIVHSTKSGSDGDWKIRDFQTGAELFSLQGSYNTIVFSPDGKLLAGAGSSEVQLWDAQTGKEIATLSGAPDAWVISAIFSPDGKRIAASGGQLIVWDVETKKVQHTLKAYSVYPMAMAFSPDSQQLACALQDATVKVWNVQTGQERLSLEHSGAGSIAFSPDGKHLVGGTWRNLIRIWDVEAGKIARTIKGPGMNAIYSPNGQRLAASMGAGMKIWDPHRDQEFQLGRRADLESPPGKTLEASISADNTIKIQNAESGRDVATLKGHTVRIWNTAFSPDGTRLASAGGGSAGGGVSRGDRAELKIWDAQSGQQLFDLPVASATVIGQVAFSPDGKQLASISGPMTIPAQLKIWDPLTGQELYSLDVQTGGGMDITYSPDGSHLASSVKNAVKLWDARTGRELFTFKNVVDFRQHVAFSSDGNRLAATSDEGARIWDVHTGREFLALKGHASHVRSVAFSPDGRRLATCSNDQTVKIWDALIGDELLTLELKWPAKVAFSADGHKLMVNADRTVHIYDATPLPEKP